MWRNLDRDHARLKARRLRLSTVLTPETQTFHAYIARRQIPVLHPVRVVDPDSGLAQPEFVHKENLPGEFF
jgi:hypothetical protein